MSTIQNDEWAQSAWEHFDEAIAQGNLALCKDIIADTQDAGFLGEARLMNEKLRSTPVSQFAIKNPIQPDHLC